MLWLAWHFKVGLFMRVIHSDGVVPKTTNCYFLHENKNHYTHPSTDSAYDGLLSSSSYLHLTFQGLQKSPLTRAFAVNRSKLRLFNSVKTATFVIRSILFSN